MTQNELLAQVSWIRSLAGSLVRESSCADDVAQEAILTLMRKPPPADRPLRPWLVRVITNLVRQGRRSEESRAHREAAIAQAVELPSSADLVERTEFHRSVVDEVLALREPLRSTVILHYFDGLPAVEIAERSGIPATTVRTHLARARQTLRERLEMRNGGDVSNTRLLLATLAVPVPSAPGSSGWLFGFSKGWFALNTLKITGVAAAITLTVVAGTRLWLPESTGAVPVERITPDPQLSVQAENAASGLAVADDERAPVGDLLATRAGETGAPLEEEPHEAVALSASEVFREVDAVALETFDGNMQLADAYDLALDLLANADPDAGEWGEDGARAFQLFQDEELGSATLRVKPGQAGKAGGFLIDVRTSSTIGYQGTIEGSLGSKLSLSFGVDGDSITSFVSRTEVQFEVDPRERDIGSFEGQIGAAVRVGVDKVTWQRQTLDSHYDENDERRGRIIFGHAESISVGQLGAGRARELAGLLKRFTIQ